MPRFARSIPFACYLLVVFAFSRGAQTFPEQGQRDESGFERIFDGRTLAGWEGDPVYWRVEEEALVGEVTPATLLKQNSFIIWRGGTTRDFELKLEYRVSDRGNSGVNYRSEEIAGQRFAMKGYQADSSVTPGKTTRRRDGRFLPCAATSAASTTTARHVSSAPWGSRTIWRRR
jgi:hypothetical protein